MRASVWSRACTLLPDFDVDTKGKPAWGGVGVPTGCTYAYMGGMCIHTWGAQTRYSHR